MKMKATSSINLIVFTFGLVIGMNHLATPWEHTQDELSGSNAAPVSKQPSDKKPTPPGPVVTRYA